MRAAFGRSYVTGQGSVSSRAESRSELRHDQLPLRHRTGRIGRSYVTTNCAVGRYDTGRLTAEAYCRRAQVCSAKSASGASVARQRGRDR